MDQPHKSTDHLPSSALAYLDPHYWDDRFSAEEHYEWFKDYFHFSHLIQPHVLELGCGNSELSDELYKDGVRDITCIDLCKVAVERMQKRLLSEEIKVLVAGMLDLPFYDERFDVVIDKGTMDVLFVDSGDPWNPHPASVAKVMAGLHGVHRILKPDGVFISISFGQSSAGQLSIIPLGKRPSLDSKGSCDANEVLYINLYHEELEPEDFQFRTNIDEMETKI
ncbi:Methyltransferase type 11 [Dillenia turbinata]|uniref:Methyltransferase type 11 n=1 Tax=Dillenia turbinata TaxID=194707 RepID=A0AAN8UJ31_9MAGN